MPIPAHTSPPVSQNAALVMSVRSGLVLVPAPLWHPGVLSVDKPVINYCRVKFKWQPRVAAPVYVCLSGGMVRDRKEGFFAPTDFLKLTVTFPVLTKDFRFDCFQNKSHYCLPLSVLTTMNPGSVFVPLLASFLILVLVR